MPARRNPFNHRLSTTLLISILYPLGPAAIILAPMIVGGVMDSYGFSDQQAGTVASMEGLGLVVASIFASLWIRKIAWRRVLFVSLLLLAAINIISANLSEFSDLLISRTLTGFLGGTVFAVAVVALGDNQQPDRAFGVGQVVQGAMMFLAFIAAPYLMQLSGVGGLFYMLAGASLLMLVVLIWFPDHGLDRSEAMEQSSGESGNTLLIWLGLIASFVFFINVFGFWAFVERIGHAAQLSAATIGLALGVAQIAAIFGALAAAVAGDRYGRSLPLMIVMVAESVVLWVLIGEFGATVFFVGTSVFQAMFMLAVSYQMGAIARIDIKGRYLVLMTAAQGIGAAVGPSLAAALITESDDYSGINLMAGICCVASILLFLFIIRRSNQSVRS
jgi:predicted MFS family arabinose efflux permease